MYAETQPRSAALPGLLTGAAGNILPGVILCAGFAAIAMLARSAQIAVLDRSWLDAPVFALVSATVLRAFWTPAPRFAQGIGFSAKQVLEVAIVLLGASLSASALLAVGPFLLAGIAVIVMASLVVSYGLSRALGLSRRSAALIASGNSICGNSAIMAVAPVIGARREEIAGAVGFTALVGIVIVVVLPFLAVALGMLEPSYGILAGLTVYAVPQVLAATAPVGALAIEIGTIVKLARVVMLAPVCILASLCSPYFRDVEETERRRPPFHKFLPWFVAGFLATAIARSLGLIPESVAPTLADASKAMTVMALAALGFSIDPVAALRSGPRVMLAAVGSVLMLLILSLGLLSILPA